MTVVRTRMSSVGGKYAQGHCVRRAWLLLSSLEFRGNIEVEDRSRT